MKPVRVGALVGAVLGALVLLPLAPILFTYIGADLAYRAGKIGEWARMPAAVGGCMLLSIVGVTDIGAVGALVGLAWDRSGAK